MIEFLFLDLDDTILDFHKAERIAIAKTFEHFGIDPNEQVLSLYHDINKAHWEMLERGELTREQVLVRRFSCLFSHFDIVADAQECARLYAQNLSIGHYFLPGAEEAVIRLSKKYRLFLASNGTASVQAGRLASANLSRFFEKIFISQEIGYNKPAIEFFQRSFSQIPNFDPQKAMIVGDSLSSDILGGIQAGIRTCWVNPTHAPARPGICPDHEIEGLYQLEALLEAL